MNLDIGKKVLKLFGPKYEEERLRFRLATSLMMASAEDVTRTIRCMNGHAVDHPIAQAWKTKKPSAP